MYAGQIVEVAAADEFFAAPKHPYARLLLRALPDAAQRGARAGGDRAARCRRCTQAFAGCRFAPRCDRAFDAVPRQHAAGADRRSARRAACAACCYADGAHRDRGRHGAARRRRGCRRCAARAAGSVRRRRRSRCSRCSTCACASRSAAACCSATHGVFSAVDDVSFDDPTRPDAGAGRRVGLRQDDDRQGDRAVAARARP